MNELQAVLGHELTHVANRDALVMSLVGLPGSIMLSVRGGGGIDGLLVLASGSSPKLGPRSSPGTESSPRTLVRQ